MTQPTGQRIIRVEQGAGRVIRVPAQLTARVIRVGVPGPAGPEGPEGPQGKDAVTTDIDLAFLYAVAKL